MRTDATRETHTGEAEALQPTTREGRVGTGWESDTLLVQQYGTRIAYLGP